MAVPLSQINLCHYGKCRSRPLPDYRQYKRNIIIGIFAVGFIVAVIGMFFPGETSVSPVIDTIAALGFNLLLFAWCFYDNLSRGKQRLRFGWFLAVFILGIFGVFIYLLRTRGVFQGLKAIGKALLLILGFVVVVFSAVFTGLILGFEG